MTTAHFCGLHETPQHTLCCTHPKVEQTWQSSPEQLKMKLSNLSTDPTLSSTIIAILNHWQSTQPLLHLTHNNPAHQQALIGWYPMLLGHLSIYWTHPQAHHYQSIQSKQSPPLMDHTSYATTPEHLMGHVDPSQWVQTWP